MPRDYRPWYDKILIVAAVLAAYPLILEVSARPEVLGQHGTSSSEAKDPLWKRWPGKSSDAHVHAGSAHAHQISTKSGTGSRNSAEGGSSSSRSSNSKSTTTTGSSSSNGKEPAWKRWPGKSGKSAMVYDDPDHSTEDSASSDRHRHHHRESSSASGEGDASSNEEEEGSWEGWTQPKLFEKSPGALGLSSITVSKPGGGGSAAPVKPTQPYTLVNFPSADTYEKASQATGMNFKASGVNRAVPNGNHGVPESSAGTTRDGQPVLLVAFKLPSTGSTFFAELLQAVPRTHVAKELLTSMDAHKDASTLATLMGAALRQPMRGHNQGVDPSARVAQLAVLGFTVCPTVLPYAHWKSALAPSAFPQRRVCVVALVRSNTVKHAVGIWRAAALRAKCHSNNVRAGDESRCALPEHGLHIAVPDFQKHLRVASLHTSAMLGSAYSTGRDVYEVTYEDLTSDPGTTLTGLYRFFGLDLAQLMTGGGSNHHNGGLAALLKKATTKKFTSENLEELLANYGELSDWLSAKASCYWPMLAAKGPESFAHCPLRFGSVYVHATATSALAATTARGH